MKNPILDHEFKKGDIGLFNYLDIDNVSKFCFVEIYDEIYLDDIKFYISFVPNHLENDIEKHDDNTIPTKQGYFISLIDPDELDKPTRIIQTL